MVNSGGSFLIETASADSVFTPEDFTPEQRAMARAADGFMEGEVLPRTQSIESQEPGLMPELLRKAAKLGLLALEIPQEYDGLGLDVITSSLVSESMGRQGSFGVSHGAHTGIGTLPLIYFGTEQQKKKYLPRLASGEMLGAYALSETSSGSDALAAKTRAVLDPAGTHYVLNGEKMWTSNGGFADLITVFAQVDGDRFTAFLVERSFPGVSPGREEHKMGIKGSSTVRIVLENAQVPIENVLHEVGRGHIVALNVLNLCRYKLAVGLLGGARDVLAHATRYAQERQQFGKPIASFGLIQHKLAEMAIRLFATESACYRLAGLIQRELDAAGTNPGTDGLPAQARVLEEFLIECAMMKVHASEMLDFVVDEALQIHGGYGYTEEFPVARAYRDSRINRIFEGTNEINRLTVAGTLLRRAERGRLGLTDAARQAEREVLHSFPPTSPGPTGDLHRALEGSRRLVLLTAGAAVQELGRAISEEQEILALVADMVTEHYVMESSLLRTEAALARPGFACSQTMSAATRVLLHDGMLRSEARMKTVLESLYQGDHLRGQIAMLRKYAAAPPANTIALRRQIADSVLAGGGYWR